MKLICAGYPKTGTKSCSAALRQLGYSVADILEQLEFVSNEWLAFVSGTGSIDDVIETFDKHGFDTAQDFPANMNWEALYDTSPPGTKVLLTVRDNDKQWFDSFLRFETHEHTRDSFLGISLVKIKYILGSWGYMGTKLQQSYQHQEVFSQNPFQKDFAEMLLLPKYYTSKAIINSIIEGEDRLRQFYRDSIKHTIEKVPAEDLLIWNVKDGWEPLCAFLGKPTPSGPIPHENKSGTSWMYDYAWQSTFVRSVEKTAIKTLSLRLGFVALCLALCYSYFASVVTIIELLFFSSITVSTAVPPYEFLT